jgi:hypothetical protein
MGIAAESHHEESVHQLSGKHHYKWTTALRPLSRSSREKRSRSRAKRHAEGR